MKKKTSPKIEPTNKPFSYVLTGLKYVFLTAFFMLLAGFFQPFVSDAPFNPLIFGTIVLFIGMFGGVLVYKGTVSEHQKLSLVGIGLGMLGLSLYLIFVMSGRI